MITAPTIRRWIIKMTEAKLQRWLKAVESELRAEPGFTDDYTGKVHVNTTQGGANAVVIEKHRPIRNSEPRK